jgi:lipoate-protein ligase A
LLYKTSEENLIQALQNDENKYSDKAVKSVRSNVTNISQHIAEIDIHSFILKLRTFLTNCIDATMEYSFSDSDKEEIEKISQNKYQTWVWNFGYSPAYTFKNKLFVQGRETEINIAVKKGIIESVKFTEELPSSSLIINALIGKSHKEDLLFVELNKVGLEEITERLFK